MKYTAQNIAENNKLIAEFMNYEWYEINKPYIAVRQPNGGVRHFQTNWNDLMEVVEKIESLGFEVQIYKSTCMIYKVGNSLSIGKDADTKIEAVYNACVEFIKFYNEQAK